MKTTALAAILAVSFGTAMAAGNYSSSDKDHRATQNQSTAAAANDQSNAKGEGLIDKTKRGLQRMGDKIRNAGNRVANSGKKDNDTRAMGAGSATDREKDSARQQRMDDAYANWNSKQKQKQ
jgi:hypothetical protein